jgi:hypothetical protein
VAYVGIVSFSILNLYSSTTLLLIKSKNALFIHSSNGCYAYGMFDLLKAPLKMHAGEFRIYVVGLGPAIE